MTGMDQRIERAWLLYERAVFEGGDAPLTEADRALDGVEADLALARGRIIHTRFLHQRDGSPDQAAEDPRELALFDRAAELYRSLELAARADDKPTMAEALRHLGIVAHFAGELDTARERLEDSNRLRREIGLLPGVASNLIGLGYIAAAQGRRGDAMALLDEAAAIAAASGAERIARSVSEARTELQSARQ